MTIGELNRRINVLEHRVERDSFGAEVGDWVIVGRVWAKIEPGVGRENLVNEQVQGTQEAKMTMRFYPAMSIKHRIQYGEKFFEVVAVKDITTTHRWTEVAVKEIIDGIQRETAESPSEY